MSWIARYLFRFQQDLRETDPQVESSKMFGEGSGAGSSQSPESETSGTVSQVAHRLTLSLQLGEITREFVLRRTADILSNYLPPKR
jgi:hypothetical protein